MTTHNDQSTPLDPMEARLRAMLTERSTDVETTPALFEDVRSRARRGTLVRRAAGAVAVAAAVTGGALVVPSLLQQPTVQPITEQPPTTAPSDAPTEAAPLPGTEGAPVIADVGVEVAVATTDGIFFRNRESLVETATVRSLGGYGVGQAQVFTLPMVTEGDDGTVRVALVDTSPNADGINDVVEATPNGHGVVMSPDGQAAAWIEGGDLHLWPVGSGSEGVRVLPIEGDLTPDDLVIEQWFAYADAPLILASQPGGGMWTIPMEESNVFNTAPVGDAFPSGGGVDSADDAVYLQDGSTVAVRVSSGTSDATVQFGDGTAFTLREPYVSSTDLELEAGAGGGLTLLDRAGDGAAMVLRFSGDDGAGNPTGVEYYELGTGLVGAVTMGVEDQPATDPTQQQGEGSGPPMPADAPLVGTDGVELVVRSTDGSIVRRELFPSAESEATLGTIAVRPGSSPTAGMVALENLSEGQSMVRFAALEGDAVRSTGAVVPTDGDVSGLVWSEDGQQLAWTDGAGLHVATIDDAGELVGDPALLTDATRAVLDWVWTDEDAGRTSGYLAVRAGPAGSELLGVDRFSEGTLVLTDPVGGGDAVFLDTHTSPGAAVGPTVSVRTSGTAVTLGWGADGDQGGELPDPGTFDEVLGLRASGGQVLVLGGDRQVMVTFTGDSVELPVLTSWDILD